MIEVTSDLAKMEEWRLVRRIAASPRFSRSAKLTDFLYFITERALAGSPQDITEQQIGIHVFGRSAGFDSGSDSIVRSQARLLRQKLDHYFAEEGREEAMVIRIPRGAYVPSFETRSVHAVEEPPAAPAPEAQMPAGSHRRIALVAAALALVATATVALLWWPARSDSSRVDALWARLVDREHRTLILPADSSLVLVQNLTGQSVTLNSYVSGEYRRQLISANGLQREMLENLANRQYTSMADVNLIERLLRQAQRLPGGADVTVRFCRFARIEDFKKSHIVLIGVKQANPWVELFEDRLNFRFEYADQQLVSYRVVNRRPLAGEPDELRQDPEDPRRRVYASLALLPNLSGTGNVLILQGTTMAGTEAAVDFAFQPGALEQALGVTPLPYFELLLESVKLGNNAQQSRVLSVRRY